MFVKICRCGERIVFERRMSFPDNCPKCGLRLMDLRTYREDDPELLRMEEPAPETAPEPEEEKPAAAGGYALRLAGGVSFALPAGECVVGRTGVGGEELADCPSVSRAHLRVRTTRSGGIIITDISTYGTLLNGRKCEKNAPVKAVPGDVITLCDTEVTVTAAEE